MRSQTEYNYRIAKTKRCKHNGTIFVVQTQSHVGNQNHKSINLTVALLTAQWSEENQTYLGHDEVEVVENREQIVCGKGLENLDQGCTPQVQREIFQATKITTGAQIVPTMFH